MSRAYSSAILEASADDVWSIVKGFNNLPDWHPSFAESKFVSFGNTRVIVLADGSSLVETLEGFNNRDRVIEYSIIETELPIQSYNGTLRVTPVSERTCEIAWFAEFEAENGSETEMREALRGVYLVGFEALKERLSST